MKKKLSLTRIVGVITLLWLTYFSQSLAGELTLRCYTYISQPAENVLQKFGITEAEIEGFTSNEIKSRNILPIDGNRLFEGSEDSLRIDIRKKSNNLLLELSVRQGVSIHYMLERWSNSQLLPIEGSQSAQTAHRTLLNSISILLDDLKANYNSPAYKEGKTIPEEYESEKDE